MTNRDAVAVGTIIWFALWVLAAVGWFINLMGVINLATSAAPVTTLFILKAFGIVVAPLGSILGLFF